MSIADKLSGNPKTALDSLMNDAQQDLKSGNFNADEFVNEAPSDLTQALSDNGIDIKNTLEKINIGFQNQCKNGLQLNAQQEVQSS